MTVYVGVACGQVLFDISKEGVSHLKVFRAVLEVEVFTEVGVFLIGQDGVFCILLKGQGRYISGGQPS
jgi:hypothetical protein